MLPDGAPWLRVDLTREILSVDALERPFKEWRTLFWELQRFIEREHALKMAGWRLPPLAAPAPVHTIHRLDEDAGDLWRLEAAADGRAFGQPTPGRAWREGKTSDKSMTNEEAA